MSPHVSAGVRATIITAVGGLPMLILLVHVLVLMFATLPLWVISDMDIPGLGEQLNGFFVPSAVGWLLIAATWWGIGYLLSLGALRDAAARRQASVPVEP